MHDNVSRLLVSERKEELLKLIAEQQERGEGRLEEDDRWLQVNLDDLETTSGETQAHWLRAISNFFAWGYSTKQTCTRRTPHLKTGFLLSGPLCVCGLLLPGAVSHTHTQNQRRVALSLRGSDCDAVWFWPSAYEDSYCHG
jgi:hypothetical protein